MTAAQSQFEDGPKTKTLVETLAKVGADPEEYTLLILNEQVSVSSLRVMAERHRLLQWHNCVLSGVTRMRIMMFCGFIATYAEQRQGHGGVDAWQHVQSSVR
jgi:hypothetical protein